MACSFTLVAPVPIEHPQDGVMSHQQYFDQVRRNLYVAGYLRSIPAQARCGPNFSVEIKNYEFIAGMFVSLLIFI